MIPAPVIVPEKVENKPIEKFVENVTGQIATIVGGDTETIEVIVRVETLKEVVSEETYTKIEALKPEEKVIVLLAALTAGQEEGGLLQNEQLVLSEQTEEAAAEVILAMQNMTDEEQEAFETMLAELFPTQEVVIGEKTYVYYLIPMEIRAEEDVTIVHYAFCYDEEEKVWLFTLVEEGEDLMDAIQDAESGTDED